MKREIFKAVVEYEKPQVRLLSCCVEKGFVTSSTLEDMTEEEVIWWY